MPESFIFMIAILIKKNMRLMPFHLNQELLKIAFNVGIQLLMRIVYAYQLWNVAVCFKYIILFLSWCIIGFLQEIYKFMIPINQIPKTIQNFMLFLQESNKNKQRAQRRVDLEQFLLGRKMVSPICSPAYRVKIKPFLQQRVLPKIRRTILLANPDDLNLNLCINIKQSNIHPTVQSYKKTKHDLCEELRPMQTKKKLIHTHNTHNRRKLLIQTQPRCEDWPPLKAKKFDRADNYEPIRRDKQPSQIKIYNDFLQAIRISNFVSLEPMKGIPTVCVSSKNNGELIKTILKSRYWINCKSQFSEQVNFIWSSKKIIDQADTYQPAPVTEAGAKLIEQQSRVNRNLARILSTSYQKMLFQNKDPPFFIQKGSDLPKRSAQNLRIVNNLPFSNSISSKKGLFQSISKYQQKYSATDSILPFTMVCQNKQQVPFIKKAIVSQPGIWIIKPGQNSNRGKGIIIQNSQERIQQMIQRGQCHNFVVQKYIEKPLLYNRRKFDIRAYMLVTIVCGHVKGYFYDQGYGRTSSYEFTLDNMQPKIHLTNDAVQNQFQNYGKYESANKLSLKQLAKYFAQQGLNFDSAWADIKEMAKVIMESSYWTFGKQSQICFELFGMDVMVDQSGKSYLIEVNSNPSLLICGNLLSVIIPKLIENTLKIGLDPYFPPPSRKNYLKNLWWHKDTYQWNRFNLVFDSCVKASGAKIEEG